MKLPDITRILAIFIGAAVIFFLGYSVRGRDNYDKSADNITITATNGNINNSLSQIQTREILGFGPDKTTIPYGTMYFNVLPNKDTEIRFIFNNIPVAYTQTGGATKQIPDNLNIFTATTSQDGKKYLFDLLGTIPFDPNSGALRTGNFSTKISARNKQPALNNVKQIVFKPLSEEQNNIYLLESGDIPPEDRNKPAPWFYVNIGI
jgi:hypothetical protein